MRYCKAGRAAQEAVVVGFAAPVMSDRMIPVSSVQKDRCPVMPGVTGSALIINELEPELPQPEGLLVMGAIGK
jgi:hypothetical protein